MKSSWFRLVILLLASSIAVISCNDSDDDTTIPTPDKGGKGGSSTLYVKPIHDTVNVDSGMVYIKYDTDIVPSSVSMYDDSTLVVPFYNVNTNTTSNIAIFNTLRKGRYVVYSKSWDKVRSQTVTGSRAYQITKDLTTFNLELQLY